MTARSVVRAWQSGIVKGAMPEKANELKGKNMEKKNMQGAMKKAYAQMMCGEEEGGSEIVQVVIVLGFAVGLGAALMLLQDQINAAIKSAGSSITNMFKSVTSHGV